MAAIAIFASCNQNSPDSYGYLLVSNQYDVDVKAHAEDPYKKNPNTYDFVFASHTETVEKMKAGGYKFTWTEGDKAPYYGVTNIFTGDTVVIIFEYPK